MSSAKKKSRHESEPSKPGYVKKLNFEERLEPNLKIDTKIAEIAEKNAGNFLPDKQDNQSFVNDWLSKNDGFFEADFVYPSSPVLGSSVTKRTPGSPIVGNFRKRRRFSFKKTPSEKRLSDLPDHPKNVQNSCLSNPAEQSGSFQEKKPFFNKSPVLINKVRSRKFRKKRLSEGKAASVKLDTLKSVTEKFEEKVIQEEEETFFEEIVEDKIEEESLNGFKSSAKDFCVFRKSPKFEDDESTFIEEVTESEETQSDFIEDVDTPDVFFNNLKEKPVILKEKIPKKSKSPSKDSDETFFSGAGSCQSQFRQQASQKISEISSSKIKADSLSQVYNIVVETESPKNFVESFVNILRTEEKKRRLKKGSLAAKLQNLVDTERSFMRMWHHKISQKTFQNDNIQFVDLCIQRFYTSYNRQFTECFLIADTYNLLKDVTNFQTDPGSNLQTLKSKNSINKLITVMTIPEFVGKLNAEKGKRLKVYPPLQILDHENIIISVTYFTVNEKVNFPIDEEKSEENVKRIEKFDCVCIQEGRIVDDCGLRFKNKKSNVIKEIFSIS